MATKFKDYFYNTRGKARAAEALGHAANVMGQATQFAGVVFPPIAPLTGLASAGLGVLASTLMAMNSDIAKNHTKIADDELVSMFSEIMSSSSSLLQLKPFTLPKEMQSQYENEVLHLNMRVAELSSLFATLDKRNYNYKDKILKIREICLHIALILNSITMMLLSRVPKSSRSSPRKYLRSASGTLRRTKQRTLSKRRTIQNRTSNNRPFNRKTSRPFNRLNTLSRSR